jgi:hypothetical protein
MVLDASQLHIASIYRSKSAWIVAIRQPLGHPTFVTVRAADAVPAARRYPRWP